jgi:uncharacterized protein (DUF952 family)
MIYHLAEWLAWQACLHQDAYRCASLDAEGFIHCSTREQLTATANRYYQNRKDLVLLCLDESRLEVPLLYEKSASTGDVYPHVYGSISKKAIISTHLVLPGADGFFNLDNSNGSAGIF